MVKVKGPDGWSWDPDKVSGWLNHSP